MKEKKAFGWNFFLSDVEKNCPCFLKCLFFCFFLGGFYETTCPTFRWAIGLESFVRNLSSKFKFEALDQLHTVMSRSQNCVLGGGLCKSRPQEIKSESSHFLKNTLFFKNEGGPPSPNTTPQPHPHVWSTLQLEIKKFNILFSVYFFELIEI
jgi:hypothetical protein